MKKISIFIFTTLILITPVFFINAAGVVKITSFSPIEGKIGDVVTITGGDFTGAGVNKVLFGSIESTIDSINATTIKTKVPAGAVDGKITVKTLKTGGIAEDLISTDIFKVKQESSTSTVETAGLDYTAYYEELAIANTMYSTTKEGIYPGDYAVGSSEKLKKVINENTLTPVMMSGITTQEEIDGYTTILQNALADFALAMVKDDNTSPKETKTSGSSSEREGFWGKGSAIVPACKDGPCGFNEFMTLINNAIRFLLFTIATPLCALIIAYAGWLYISGASSEESKGKAKKILTNVVIGYAIALAAFVIVKTILSSLGASTTWLG